VDIYDILMSLKSRLPSVLGPALNTLTLLAQSVRATPHDHGIHFPLQHCDDLVEELVEILGEAASRSAAATGQGSLKQGKLSAKAGKKSALTYRQLHTEALDEEQRIRVGHLDSVAPLDPAGEPIMRQAEIVLSVIAILRNFSVSAENVDFLSQHDTLIPVLLRLCDLLDDDNDAANDRGLRLDALDLLSVRKDTLEILANFGDRVSLDAHEGDQSTPRALLALLNFFLTDASDRDQMSHDASPIPPPPLSTGSSSGHPPPSTIRSPVRTGAIGRHVDVALTVLSRVLVTDSNRASIASLPAASTIPTLAHLFEALLQLLPLSESELEAGLTTEPGLVIVERIAMSLYNVAFLLDERSKAHFGQRPGVTRLLARIIRKFSSYVPPIPAGAPTGTVGADYARNPYAVLCDRCMETLRLLSDGTGLPRESTIGMESGKGGDSGPTTKAIPEQWFGGGFAPVPGAGGRVSSSRGVSTGLTGSKALLSRPPVLASLTPAEALEMHLRGPSDAGFFAALGHLWDTRRGAP
jgi:hypothetical protein